MSSKEKKALVLGLGNSGYTMAKFLHSRGWSLVLADTRTNPPKYQQLIDEGVESPCVWGEPSAGILEGCTLVAISPGLSPEHSLYAPLIQEARAKKIEVVGEIELFARELQRLRAFRNYRPKIIGITGTNGKTTTTILSSKMVEAAGHTVCCAGNVGPNALGCLDRLLKENQLPEYWVLELSSFQLETTSSLTCTSAALLNLTEDHVDWHGSIGRYLEAKARIFRGAQNRILNRGDSASFAFSEGAGKFNVFTFGLDKPRALNDFGVVEDGPVQWLAAELDLLAEKNKRRKLAEIEGPIHELVKLLPREELKIRGPHNVMNALAAAALCFSAGVDLKGIIEALDEYKGEPHRVEKIWEAQGLTFIDDSKGTNVGATAAALTGFPEKKVVIILGGDGKGQDFWLLKEPLVKHAHHAVIIGKDAPLFREVLETTDIAFTEATTMLDAVDKAIAVAQQGDFVLLSPACASWDMFKDYADRSAQFKAAAVALTGNKV